MDEGELEAAEAGTLTAASCGFFLDGEKHRTSIERLRGEVKLRTNYRGAEEEARDRERLRACGTAIATRLGTTSALGRKGFVPAPTTSSRSGSTLSSG